MVVARKNRLYASPLLGARLYSMNRVSSRLVAKIHSRDVTHDRIYNPRTTRCRIPLIRVFINKVHKRKKESDKTCLCKSISHAFYVHVDH